MTMEIRTPPPPCTKDAQVTAHPRYPLWSEALPFPPPEQVTRPVGAIDRLVHRADAEYAFLHDCTLAKRGGVLHAAWYNCPEYEMEGASVIRTRRSSDGGATWSGVETLSADPTGDTLHVPPVLHNEGGTLYAWVLQMTAIDIPTSLLLYRLEEGTTWRCLGEVAERFLPNGDPTRLPDGSYAMAGRMAFKAGTRPLHPAIAFCRGGDLTGPWEPVPLTRPENPIGCPETGLIVTGQELTAIVRPGDWEAGDPLRHARVATSADAGRTWSPLAESNLPMHPSKPFGGTLSTGARYLIFNCPGGGGGGRELLTLALSAPGEQAFSSLWAVQNGTAHAFDCGPEWSYPFAIEADGKLHIIYTAEKKHSVLTSIPLCSLKPA